MPGSKTYRKLQMGLETTSGTAVAATMLWRGGGVIEDQREVNFVEEDVGYFSGVDRTHTAKLLAAVNMDDVPATFEQLPYILSAGIKNVVTGSADTGTGASGKIYTYTFPTTTKNTIKTYTIEGGDDQEAEEVEYAFVESFKLSGRASEALTMGATWLGRQVTVSSFTGAISVPTVEDILVSKGKLYIDTAGGTVGTTQISNSLLGVDINVKTGWTPVWTVDGNLYFTFNKPQRMEMTVDLTFEHDAVGTARKVDWRAETAKQFRLLFTGAALQTAGSAYTNKTLKIDFVAKVEKVSALGEQDGNDILTVTLRPRYNATANKFAEIVVVNEVATLP